jgi:hypothetical protein
MAQNQNPQAPALPPATGPRPQVPGAIRRHLERDGSDARLRADNVSGLFTLDGGSGGSPCKSKQNSTSRATRPKGWRPSGYDPATDRLPLTVYSSMVGVPIP